MGPSTKQKQRQKQAQQVQITQQQCLSVIQNIVECGIASICHHRNLFPSSFFAHPSIGGSDEASTVAGGGGGMDDGSAVTQFDVDALLSTIPSTTTSRAKDENRVQQQTSMESTSTSQVSANVSHSSSDPSNSESNNDDEDEIVSPLTASMTMTYTKSSESQYTHALHPTQPLRAMSHKDLIQQRLKAEALILLRWLREGVGDAMKKGMLSRVIFGICLPASTYDSEVKGQKQKVVRLRDKLIESYAFDIATNSNSNSNSCCENNEGRDSQSTSLQHSKRKKRNHSRNESSQQQEQEMMEQSRVLRDTEALFRNLRVYSTSLPPVMGDDNTTAKRELPQSQKGLFNSSTTFTQLPILSQAEAASLRSLPPLPSQRYLTLRVEFVDSIYDHHLPTALSPSSPLMISNYHHDEIMSSSSPSSVQELSVRNEVAMTRPLDGHATTGERGLRNMIPVSIGDVIMSSEKCTDKKRRKRKGEFGNGNKSEMLRSGLGVRMVAFGRDDDEDDESEDYFDLGGNQHDDGDSHTKSSQSSLSRTKIVPNKRQQSSQISNEVKEKILSRKKKSVKTEMNENASSSYEEILTCRMSTFPEESKSPPDFSSSSPSCIIGVSQPTDLATLDQEENQIFLKDTKVMALPYGLGNSKKNRRYLPCTIFDHRVLETESKGSNKNDSYGHGADHFSSGGEARLPHQNGREKQQVQYKVLFDHRKLARLGRMKQWVPSKRVMSMDVILRRIFDAFARHNYDGSTTVQSQSNCDRINGRKTCGLCPKLRDQIAQDHMVTSGVVEAAARAYAKEQLKKVAKSRNGPSSEDLSKQVAKNHFHLQDAQELPVEDGYGHDEEKVEGCALRIPSGRQDSNFRRQCSKENKPLGHEDPIKEKAFDANDTKGNPRKRRYCFIADPIHVEF